MTSIQLQGQLRPNDLAFYFESDKGVSAAPLGKFLQRVATVAKRSDADLQVVALRDGSLALVVTPIKRTIKAAGKEFEKSPIATTVATILLANEIYSAICGAMNPTTPNPAPLVKAAAELVQDGHVKSIELVASDKSTVIMDFNIAIRVQRTVAIENVEVATQPSQTIPSRQLVEMAERAIEGGLSGEVLDVEGKLHFRPDGHNYLVPIQQSEQSTETLIPNKRYNVKGQIHFEFGLPELIKIDAAKNKQP